MISVMAPRPSGSIEEYATVSTEPRTHRLTSIDLLRGLLMILMALDHTRAYFSASTVDPVDPRHSWAALFMTRWVTHLCAPGFIALAGASVYLQRQRGKTPQHLSRLLVTRGLWLAFLEITVISFGWSFIFPAPFLQVIWAIGISMIALAALLRLPTVAIGVLGTLVVVLHNLLDPIQAQSLGRFADTWKMLHQSGMLLYDGRPIGFDLYPVLPWIGVICLGYAFGPLAIAARGTGRYRALMLAGGFLSAFALLRFRNGYGDPIHFERLSTPAQTAMSFFDVEKYPPSLEYVLVTFGVLLLLYVVADLVTGKGWLPRVSTLIETYGRVPFLYYVLHIYLIHVAALLTSMATRGNWRFWIGTGLFTGRVPAGWGYSLPVVYMIWVAVVAALYLPCLWFSRFKATHRNWWLSYL